MTTFFCVIVPLKLDQQTNTAGDGYKKVRGREDERMARTKSEKKT